MSLPTLDADIAATTIKVSRALEQAHVPYAIGGAIALTMHGFAAGLAFNRDVAEREAETEGWFTAWDGIVTRFGPHTPS